MKKKTFTIDADKWVCGSFDDRGNSLLLNKEGHMCCLGQIMSQCGASNDAIKHRCSPDDVERGEASGVGFLVRMATLGRVNSSLTNEAMDINDSDNDDGSCPSPWTRAKRLRKLFKAEGITLKFKNILKYKKNDC